MFKKFDGIIVDEVICYEETVKMKLPKDYKEFLLDTNWCQFIDEIHMFWVDELKENIGIDILRLELKGKISVFAGNSGVGKSSTINVLFGENKTLEGEISQKNKKGKNTTTDTRLYELESKTYIADTPGFSSFEITEIESNELDKNFREFKDKIRKCEFVGCTHIKEQNCEIKRAVTNGEISKERYDNYCKIYEELKEKEKYRW